MAAQLTLTNAPDARVLAACSDRARRPLPVPVSPRSKTGGTRCAVATRERRRRTCAWMATIPGLWPISLATGSIKSDEPSSRRRHRASDENSAIGDE